MIVSGFRARADIVGRRMRVGWDFVPEGAETLADIPPVTLRRKQRDYAWPPVVAPDPMLVYDGGSFPPAPIPALLSVTDLNGWEQVVDGQRHVFVPVSVAIESGGRMVEILRRTTQTVFDANGVALRQRVEILDVGMLPGTLQPGHTYYYQLFSRDLPASGDDATPYRDAAMATGSHGQNRLMYQAIPEIYRRHDVLTAPAAPGQDSVPELAPAGGQLRRFIDPFGIATDSLRSTADGLRTLHDIDNVHARFLPLIAQWIGWDLSVDTDIPLLRNELKTASRLYGLVGTLPGLRALVGQFTGWFTQVAEFAQSIAQSNQPPRRNVYAIAATAAGTEWFGVDDVADVLGFGAANREAAGAAGVAATLTGSNVEPFALRPGMRLTLAVDGLLPVTMRFASADFADITQATAAEVAAAIASVLGEVRADVAAGSLTLASDTVGAQSMLEIVPAPTSLVTLAGSATGRLAPCVDSAGRTRLFYETWETPTQSTPLAAATASTAASLSGSATLRQIRYKTFVDDAWRDSQPLFMQTVTPQADPAAVVLPDDRIWTAWLDDPQTSTTRLRWALGASQPMQSARLLGRRAEPFALTGGTVLSLSGRWAGFDTWTVHAADFANLAQASAAEIVAAMNAQLAHAVAAREQDGSISIATVVGGALTTLAVALAHSTTARAVGFDERNAVGTPGAWPDAITGLAALDVASLAPGRHAEICAVADPAGGVRLALASHRAGLWCVDTLHWNDRVLVGTANGLFERDQAGPWTAVPGLPSTDIRAIAVDADGTAWIASAAGVTLRRLDGTIAALTPALPSADVRDIVLAPDGSAAIATAAGLALRLPDATLAVIDVGAGLPSNDVRALALAPDGSLWIATAGGVAHRAANGALAVLTTTSTPALPSDFVQGVCVDAAGTAYVATSAGLAIVAADGTLQVVDAGNGLAASDARAATVSDDGTLWVATAGGVSQRGTNGQWQAIDSSAGLASNDVRGLSRGIDGTLWIATAAGISLLSAAGEVANLDLLGGGMPNPAGRSIHTGWSAPLQLAAGGGGNREPALAVDATGRTWVAWSQRLGVGTPDDNWNLHGRIQDPATLAWGVDTLLTTPPAGAHAADRTPGLQAIAAGAMRVFFASDRDGGSSLWSVDVSAAAVASAPTSLSRWASSDLSPAPLTMAGATWLLSRGDANVSLGQAGTVPGTAASQASARVADNGTVRRFSGSVAMDLRDLDRLRTRRVFGDLLSYTPNRPDNVGTLADDELYTRGTVGLYVSPSNQGAAMTDAETGRLRELLDRFVPINLRAEVIVVERADVEFVYPGTTGPQDSYADDYPFVDALGPISDSSAAAMPDLFVLEANVAADVSADPADLGTLRGRTYFPPPL